MHSHMIHEAPKSSKSGFSKKRKVDKKGKKYLKQIY